MNETFKFDVRIRGTDKYFFSKNIFIKFTKSKLYHEAKLSPIFNSSNLSLVIFFVDNS